MIAALKPVVREDDLLLPCRGQRVAGRPLLEEAVDADGVLELPGFEVGGRQPADGVHGELAPLLGQVCDGAIDRVDARVGEHDVLERFGLELDPIAARLSFRIRDHFLELRDRGGIGARVVVAPGQLVEGERVQLGQPVRGRLLEGGPRAGKIVGGEEVLADLHVGVGDEAAARILLDQRAVPADSLRLAPAVIEVVRGDEEDFVAPLVPGVPVEDELVDLQRLLPVPVAPLRVGDRFRARARSGPAPPGLVVFLDFL